MEQTDLDHYFEYAERAKQFFHFPTRTEVLKETFTLLPFPHFGITGGYGALRSDLCKFAIAGMMSTAKEYYFLLIAQTVVEHLEEYPSQDIIQALVSLRANTTNTGHMIEEVSNG